MIFEASHTHLYPGHEGKVSGLERLADLLTERECLIEFSDGSATPARILRSGADWQLRCSAYRTAAGTNIAAKRWRVSLEERGGRIEFRILGKAQT